MMGGVGVSIPFRVIAMDRFELTEEEIEMWAKLGLNTLPGHRDG
jgi:hypothetical protein